MSFIKNALKLLDSWYEEAFVEGKIKTIVTTPMRAFGSLVLQIPVSVTIYEYKSGKITYIVGPYMRISGFSHEELLKSCESRFNFLLKEAIERKEKATSHLEELLEVLPPRSS